MRTPSIPIAATLSISLVLALQGCASTKEDIFPKDMRPMSEVYDRHFAKLRMRGIEGARVQLHGERRPPRSETSGATSPAAQVPPAAHGQAHPELAGYTREAHDEIEARFPVLPNPQLVLYVYPHLGEDGAPVPGYATAFPLYERIEYALPGEVR
jgi:conjugative transfer region lipoprotein (TIGR03751 family)